MIFVRVSRRARSLNLNASGYKIEKEVEYMASNSGFYKGEKKKFKKTELEKKAMKQMGGSASWTLPQVEIIKKGKKDW